MKQTLSCFLIGHILLVIPVVNVLYFLWIQYISFNSSSDLWLMWKGLSKPWGFSRQEYWNELTFPPLGDLTNPGMETEYPWSPALANGFLHWAMRETEAWGCYTSFHYTVTLSVECRILTIRDFTCIVHFLFPQRYVNICAFILKNTLKEMI